jgi:hypothetical protein
MCIDEQMLHVQSNPVKIWTLSKKQGLIITYKQIQDADKVADELIDKESEIIYWKNKTRSKIVIKNHTRKTFIINDKLVK